MTILVPVSGGPDSLYALKKAVEHGEGVHALRVFWDRPGFDRMYNAAAAAHVEYYREWISKVHKYQIGTPPRRSYVDVGGRYQDVEYVILPLAASVILDHPDITAMSMGVSREEYGMWGDITQHPSFKMDQEVMRPAYKALLQGRDIDRYANVLPAPTKQEIRDYVGEYLWHSSASCSSPTINNQICNECVKCQYRAATVDKGGPDSWTGPEIELSREFFAPRRRSSIPKRTV